MSSYQKPHSSLGNEYGQRNGLVRWWRAENSTYLQVYFHDSSMPGYQSCVYNTVPQAGQWHHVAGTFQQINSSQVRVKMYLDGSPVRTNDLSGNLVNALSPEPVTIGADNVREDYLVGMVDEAT